MRLMTALGNTLLSCVCVLLHPDNRFSVHTTKPGIGLFFEKESLDGSTFPVVKDITHKGSAFREGSVKTGEVLLYIDGRSCRDITLKTLKESVRMLTHLGPSSFSCNASALCTEEEHISYRLRET